MYQQFKLSSCTAELSMRFFLLMNIKMPTIIGFWIFISRKNFMLNWVGYEKKFYDLRAWFLAGVTVPICDVLPPDFIVVDSYGYDPSGDRMDVFETASQRFPDAEVNSGSQPSMLVSSPIDSYKSHLMAILRAQSRIMAYRVSGIELLIWLLVVKYYKPVYFHGYFLLLPAVDNYLQMNFLDCLTPSFGKIEISVI